MILLAKMHYCDTYEIQLGLFSERRVFDCPFHFTPNDWYTAWRSFIISPSRRGACLKAFESYRLTNIQTYMRRWNYIRRRFPGLVNKPTPSQRLTELFDIFFNRDCDLFTMGTLYKVYISFVALLFAALTARVNRSSPSVHYHYYRSPPAWFSCMPRWPGPAGRRCVTIWM